MRMWHNGDMFDVCIQLSDWTVHGWSGQSPDRDRGEEEDEGQTLSGS